MNVFYSLHFWASVDFEYWILKTCNKEKFLFYRNIHYIFYDKTSFKIVAWMNWMNNRIAFYFSILKQCPWTLNTAFWRVTFCYIILVIYFSLPSGKKWIFFKPLFLMVFTFSFFLIKEHFKSLLLVLSFFLQKYFSVVYKWVGINESKC